MGMFNVPKSRPVSDSRRSVLMKREHGDITLRSNNVGRDMHADINDGPLVIGRRGDLVPLMHECLSRHHAQLAFDGEAWTLVDLGSVNGTYVNYQQISSSPVRLNDGDIIHFCGLFQYEVEVERAD